MPKLNKADVKQKAVNLDGANGDVKLDKAQGKRFDEKYPDYPYVEKGKAIVKVNREDLKQHLAQELAIQKTTRGIHETTLDVVIETRKQVKKEIIEKLEKMKGLHWQDIEDKFGNEVEDVYGAVLDQAIKVVKKI